MVTVKMKVKAAKAKDFYFKGLFVQARKVNDTTDSYGTFSTNDNTLQTLDCFNKNAVSL